MHTHRNKGYAVFTIAFFFSIQVFQAHNHAALVISQLIPLNQTKLTIFPFVPLCIFYFDWTVCLVCLLLVSFSKHFEKSKIEKVIHLIHVCKVHRFISHASSQSLLMVSYRCVSKVGLNHLAPMHMKSFGSFHQV